MKNSILHFIFTICLVFSAPVIHAQTVSKNDSAMSERPIDSALVQISKLEPQAFMSKSNYGFQVDKFEKVFPSMVFTKLQVVKTKNSGKNTVKRTVATKHIDYASLVPVLVAAMQEQQALILKQQQQIEDLQKLMNAK